MRLIGCLAHGSGAVPAALVAQWADELRKYAPSLRVARAGVGGQDRARSGLGGRLLLGELPLLSITWPRLSCDIMSCVGFQRLCLAWSALHWLGLSDPLLTCPVFR